MLGSSGTRAHVYEFNGETTASKPGLIPVREFEVFQYNRPHVVAFCFVAFATNLIIFC